MGKSLFESACEMKLGSLGRDAEDGFVEAEDAVGGGFEGLRSGIVGEACDDDLDWVMGEERGSEAVGSGEKAVLRGDAGESFKCFLGEGVVGGVAGEGVHSNQGNGGDGIGAGRRGILVGLAAVVEAAPRAGGRRACKDTASCDVTLAG